MVLEIPGAHARGLNYCPEKKLQEKGPPTPIIPPPDWQPRKSGSVTAFSLSPLLTEPTIPGSVTSCELNATELDKIQALTDRSFTMTVPQDKHTDLKALAHKQAHVWFLREDPAQITSFMADYRAVKADEPTISLCIMVPKGFGAWRTCLHSMKVLKEYKSGDCVFADANAPLKQAMQILYDPPAQEFDPQARLRMLVQAVVQGFTVNALLDSGSTNSCISKDIVSSGMLETSTTSTREVRAF